jgi:hypothetical protein
LRLSRGEIAARAMPRIAREAVLQRENALCARMKKQDLPAKNPFFRLDAPFFSFSIRSASASAVFHWWFINF